MIEQIIKYLQKKKPKVLTAAIPDQDFIPYVCHYDPSTILTKNGELLQTIRVTGFGGESISTDLISLRDTLRDSISEHVKENKFAFWFHTIRRKKNIVPSGEFPDFFSQKINESWVKANKWDDQYVNELYITIIIEGLDTSIHNFDAFYRSLSFNATKNLHQNFLADSFKNLSRVSLKILAEIEEYGGRMLTIEEREDGVLYSEPMRFFGKIVNLQEEHYPLAANDISDDIMNHKIAFGNRELEVAGLESKNFAAMLSIKEYHEVSTGALERILQLPFEFIITQSFDFAFNKKDIEEQQYQNHILEISGDEEFRQLSYLANFVESDHHVETDFCHVQSTVMLINKDKEVLEKDVGSIVEKFGSLGFILVREDVFSEHCFWSQLPGNFAFLRRQKIINTLRIAGFASLHNFPAGAIEGNHWGPAITTLKTVLNTPYFFSFHEKNLGHTLVLGPQGSGKTTFVNFLIAQAQKFGDKVFYFDSGKSSKVFVEALGGDYKTLTKNIDAQDFLQLNPFSLPSNKTNIDFLTKWIQELIEFLKGKVPEEEIALIPQIVEQALNSPSPSFLTAFDLFSDATKTPNLYEKLKIWGNGKLGYVFGSAQESQWQNAIQAFDLDEIKNQKPILIPVMSYLLQRLEILVDDSPSIIIFDDTWDLLDNPVLSNRLNDFLQTMRARNCAVIFVGKSREEIDDSYIAHHIKENIATQIYLPDKDPGEYCKSIFELSDEEFDILKMMDANDRNFLLKQQGEAIIIDSDLDCLGEMLKILSADELTLTAFEEVIENFKQKNPGGLLMQKDWILQLIEVLKSIEKEKREAELEARRAAKRQQALSS